MNKPDFQAMSRHELHQYVLAHRDDQAAFYAYIDRLHTEAIWTEMPLLDSVDELDNYPEFVERFSKVKPQDEAL